MNLKKLEEKLLSYPFAELTFPFDYTTKVYKVNGKMFALVNSDNSYINLKNEIIENEMLRDAFDFVKPGYHMNKNHWNSWYFVDELSEELLFKQIDISYQLVVSKFSKKVQREILGN